VTGIVLPPAPRILLVMMSAVGDAVHALPVVAALKRRYPAAHLTWVLQPGPASLVRGHPDVDEIVIFRRGAGWRAFAEVRRALGGARFDLVLDLQVYFKASIVTALARSPVKLGFDRARARDFNWLITNRKIPPHPPQHVQDQYFEFLDLLGVPHEPVEWKLGPWPEERARQAEFFRTLDRPAAALVIGSSRAEKEWIPERWAAVADRLYDNYGLQPVLVGGRSERELATEREILARARHPVVSTLGIPFRELVGVLDGSALVISLDTGPLHISVALGRPVISLMSALDPQRVGPYRRFHDLLIDAYHLPGEVAQVSAKRRPSRMAEITVEQVMEKVEIWRERYAAGEEG
jgi:heptosyltransferase I